MNETICVVGGAGHVGLPLALAFASRGIRAIVYDQDEATLRTIAEGRMPFLECGGECFLAAALRDRMLECSSHPRALSQVDRIVLTIGTPVDEYLSPRTHVFKVWADQTLPFLRDGQLLALRSTVYPGTTEWLDRYLRSHGKALSLAYCPERIVEGHALTELFELPQIVAGTSAEATAAAAALYRAIAPVIVPMQPREAEFAKLFTNAYRYVQFAVANQFYMIARDAGVSYATILRGLKQDYGRARDIPTAGLAAGPCLLKDTMQLASCSRNQFSLGLAAMAANEGLALYLVEQLRRDFPLARLTVGLLGMAFKADSDDVRSSLSYKIKKSLALEARRVLTTDPHVRTDPGLVPLEQVLSEADILVLCVPHTAYRSLPRPAKPFVDVWGVWDDTPAPLPPEAKPA